MSNVENSRETATNPMVVNTAASPPRQQQSPRGVKRPAGNAASQPRKQQAVADTTTLSVSSTTSSTTSTTAASKSQSNDRTANVTRRLVRVPGSQNGNQRQGVQSEPANITTTINQGELVTCGQPILLNTSGGLVLGSNTNHDSTSATRIAYIPNNAVSITGTSALPAQQIQLQAVDGGAGPYYIMLPSGTELISATSATSSTTPSLTSARIITAPRIQQAAFIPFSRLESLPVQAATIGNTHSSTSTTPLDLFSDEPAAVGSKDIKRRVSHNEVEKRRREKINNWISKLARVVPCSPPYTSVKAPMSKGGVLAKTVEYVQELRETNEHLIDSLRHYEDVTNCLKEENVQLRNLLQQAGIEAPPALVLDIPLISADICPRSNTDHVSSTPLPVNRSSASITIPTSTSMTLASGAIPATDEDGTSSAAFNVCRRTFDRLTKGQQFFLFQSTDGEVGMLKAVFPKSKDYQPDRQDSTQDDEETEGDHSG